MRPILFFFIILFSCTPGFALKEQVKITVYSFESRNIDYKIENEIMESICSKLNSSGYFQCLAVREVKEILSEDDIKYSKSTGYSLTGNITELGFRTEKNSYIPFIFYAPKLECKITSNIYLYDNENKSILKLWKIDMSENILLAYRLLSVNENDPDLIPTAVEKKRLLNKTLNLLYDDVYNKIMKEIGEEI
jgi:hypothetical protein